MTDSPDVQVVLVTTPSEGVGRTLARSLVEEELAACVNVLPEIHSIYRWDDKVQEDAECLLIIKSTRAGFGALRDRVTELHPYDVPEVLGLPVTDGSSGYLKWVVDSVRVGGTD